MSVNATSHIPVEATALLIDMRDFTPTYNAMSRRGDEFDFLGFIEKFYAACSDACRASYSTNPGSSLYVNCTGDGILAVFLADKSEPESQHTLRAYLAALRLLRKLPPLFHRLDGSKPTEERPRFRHGPGVRECGARGRRQRASPAEGLFRALHQRRGTKFSVRCKRIYRRMSGRTRDHLLTTISPSVAPFLLLIPSTPGNRSTFQSACAR